jgi:RimJ/RimL family protein N-acetyltransferase
MTGGVVLRDVSSDDLPIFFEQQLDPAANHMAAFAAKDPADRDAFDAKWAKILADDTLTVKTILFEGQVAGNVACHCWFGEPEVCYWLGRPFWGMGIATAALDDFLHLVERRPLSARVAKGNLASLRVLEKCGFVVSGSGKGFAHARGAEVEEVILRLDAGDGRDGQVRAAVLAPHIELRRVADLTSAERSALHALTAAVYPPEVAAAWPGRAIEWAAPEWCVVVWDGRGNALCHVGVVVRDARLNGQGARIGGIGGVKTHPAARRRGHATAAIRRAVAFLRDEMNVAFALLVCEPDLIAFYERLGWRRFAGVLLVSQRGATVPFTFNPPMTSPVCLEGELDGTIDLLGPPW